jgi:hypothetical protein
MQELLINKELGYNDENGFFGGTSWKMKNVT